MTDRNDGERDLDDLAHVLARIAVAAGEVIMKVYNTGTEHRSKADGSPVTDADEQAEAMILAELAHLYPGIPVVAEEAVARGALPVAASRFFLVDPLDGTREFVSRNGEFTVNIALVEYGRPVAGVVYAPALGELYGAGNKAWRAEVAACGGGDIGTLPISARPCRVNLTAVASRSHADPNTETFLSTLSLADRRSIGSSLKFCLIARGEADVYPRLAPTMEWDTAAGHAVLGAAGGRVVTEDGLPLLYGKHNTFYRNPGFIAWGADP